MYYVFAVLGWMFVCFAAMGSFDSLLFGLGSGVLVSAIVKACE